jgi:hypothetical protein
MRDTATKVLLIVIAIGNGVVGLWASVAPHNFYDNFPGGGRAWIAVDGPFNEHLIRDVGTLNLALTVVVIAALVRPARYLLQVVAGAELVNALPHFLYHVTHLDPYGSSDKVALVGSLAIAVVAPIALLVVSSRASDRAITV